MDINRARKLAGLPLLEKYASSADFDGDVNQMLMHLAAVKKIANSKNFREHLASTERNFEVAGLIEDSNEIVDSCTELHKMVNDFYTKIIKASA